MKSPNCHKKSWYKLRNRCKMKLIWKSVTEIWILGLLILIACSSGCSGSRTEPKEVWISSILASPSNYWNVEVKVIGVVQDIKVFPQGTNQGYYWLMDRNNQKIEVKTTSLPPSGQEVVIVGLVGQNPENTAIPLIVEIDRQWVWTSFIFIISGALLLLFTLLFLLMKVLRKPTNEGPHSPEPTSPSPVPKAVERKVTNSAKEKKAAAQKKADIKMKQHAQTVFLDASKIVDQFQKDSPKKRITIEIEVIAGPDKGKVYHFTRSIITIGRSGRRLNDVELKDITISREQARLELNRNGDGFVLHNEGKTNPSLVNGKALAVANLKPEDEILVGTTMLKYRVIS